MTVEYLQTLLATAEQMLATTTTLPRGRKPRRRNPNDPRVCFEYCVIDECYRDRAKCEGDAMSERLDRVFTLCVDTARTGPEVCVGVHFGAGSL